MSGKEEAKRYTATQLIIAGIRDGLNLKLPFKWIKRQVVIRTAVAWCVFWSSAAFLASMVITDVLGISGESTFMNLFVFYPLSAIMQFLCSPQHKLIANTMQRKIQHFEAKNAAKEKGSRKSTAAVSAGGDSLGILELLEGVTKSLTDTIFRMLLYYVVLVETMIVSVLPLGIGWLLRVALCSWLYVFNCLLVRWTHYEWRINRVLAEFRLRWLYYLGLGLPFSFLCNTFSFMTNVLLYCILFPFFEIFVISAADGDKKGPYKTVPTAPSPEPTTNSAPSEPKDIENAPSSQDSSASSSASTAPTATSTQQQKLVKVPVFFCAEFIVNKFFVVLSFIKTKLFAPKDSKDDNHTKEE